MPKETRTKAKTISVFHAVNPGDLIAAMGALKTLYEISHKKIILLQSTQQLAQYYAGATHPTINKYGENVCCNDNMFDMLKPLIESQEYIHSMEVYGGQKMDLNFNVIRDTTNVNIPFGAIQNWIPLAFPDLYFDISKAWIELKEKCPKYIAKQVKGKVILNFTERYRNNFMDYYFLRNYSPDLIFAGTEKEHFLFTTRWNLNIPYLKVTNFLDLAHAIKNSLFLMGNQSMCINIAYAIGSPRITEICAGAPNVIPMIGEHCYGYLTQAGAEYNFRNLYSKTKRVS